MPSRTSAIFVICAALAVGLAAVPQQATPPSALMRPADLRNMPRPPADQQLAYGVAQTLIWGDQEDYVPQPLAEQYVAAATRAGDRARLVLIPAAGHFETASPFTSAWPMVREAIRSLLLN